MINATDLKNSTTFLFEGNPYKVLKYSLIKMGRGGATVRVSVRDLLTGRVSEKTFSSNSKVEDLSTKKRKLQYLYKDDVNAIFMDPVNFQQIDVPLKVMQDEIAFIKEGENVDILFWEDASKNIEDKVLSLELPPKVILSIKETDPGVKGNSASNVYKPALLENGLEIKVPLFIKTGDKVRVDTRTKEYVERAK